MDRDGDTALTLAAKESHYSVVKLLLDRGADANAKHKKDHTAITILKKWFG